MRAMRRGFYFIPKISPIFGFSVFYFFFSKFNTHQLPREDRIWIFPEFSIKRNTTIKTCKGRSEHIRKRYEIYHRVEVKPKLERTKNYIYFTIYYIPYWNTSIIYNEFIFVLKVIWHNTLQHMWLLCGERGKCPRLAKWGSSPAWLDPL